MHNESLRPLRYFHAMCSVNANHRESNAMFTLPKQVGHHHFQHMVLETFQRIAGNEHSSGAPLDVGMDSTLESLRGGGGQYLWISQQEAEEKRPKLAKT